MTIKELIIKKIKEKGSIDVGEFIQICQFENNGYYLRKNPIGRQNDFTTAPEISQMFGEILTIYLINYWEEKLMTKFNLIELGPGTGTLIIDILRTATANKKFFNEINLKLIEKNENLIVKQKNNLHNVNFYSPISIASELSKKTRNHNINLYMF